MDSLNWLHLPAPMPTWPKSCIGNLCGPLCSVRKATLMLGIPRRYSHFIFGVIQAGLTSLIAAGIASFPSPNPAQFFFHWLSSWFVAWIAMLPVVVLAAPAIRALSVSLTREE